MRNAHPEYIANFISQAIPRKTKLVLNADDLISSRIAPENDRVYFAVDGMETDVVECINLINDLQICPTCSGERSTTTAAITTSGAPTAVTATLSPPRRITSPQTWTPQT